MAIGIIVLLELLSVYFDLFGLQFFDLFKDFLLILLYNQLCHLFLLLLSLFLFLL